MPFKAGSVIVNVNDLPGGYVAQNIRFGGPIEPVPGGPSGDCFSACISMLTGIPLSALPVVPPSFHIGCISDRITGEVTVHPDFSGAIDGWIAALADSGFRVTVHDSPPDHPSIGVFLIWEGFASDAPSHAVVHMPDGTLIDPVPGQDITTATCMDVAYISVMPM
jgi:hypothetical protein